MLIWKIVVDVARSITCKGLSSFVSIIVNEESALKDISSVAPGVTGSDSK